MKISHRSLPVRALLTGVLLAMGSGAQAQELLGYVSRVPTGDTLYVAVGKQIETVSYLGIRKPATVHATHGRTYDDAAQKVNRQLVEGKWVRLILDGQPRDRDGRLLAYVYVGDRFVNAELVHRGYAEASPHPPNGRYREYFLGLERGARAAGRGLWADSAPPAGHHSQPLEEKTMTH